jgi:hypothetical protein
MFNRLIDSTQVQLGRGSSSRTSGGSTCRRRTEQDIANEKMEQQLRENEEYKLHSHAYFEQQGIPFPQVQLPPLAPLAPPHSWMHNTRHASAEICQTWSIIAKFSLLLFIMLNLETSSYLVNYSSI